MKRDVDGSLRIQRGILFQSGRSKDSEGSFPVVISGEPGNLE